MSRRKKRKIRLRNGVIDDSESAGLIFLLVKRLQLEHPKEAKEVWAFAVEEQRMSKEAMKLAELYNFLAETAPAALWDDVRDVILSTYDGEGRFLNDPLHEDQNNL